MKKARNELTKAGSSALVQKLARPISNAQQKLLDAAVTIHENPDPDSADLAFMARQLIQCTLPHSDPCISFERIPGTRKRKRVEVNVPAWQREDGNAALILQPGWDKTLKKSIGYPYGAIPRLLLFWIVAEAVRTQKPRLTLGRNLAKFMRSVGLDPNGGGKRSDYKRLKDQMRRLFRCHITFDGTLEADGAHGDRWKDMPVAEEGELWWHPHPDQDALWESWIELGPKFFDAVRAYPVPLDTRALRGLKQSPLALDLYAWVCHRAFVIMQRNQIVRQYQKPKIIKWQWLKDQFGADYSTVNNFQKKAIHALRKIETVYPGLSIGKAAGGFTIHVTRLAVPQKAAVKLIG